MWHLWVEIAAIAVLVAVFVALGAPYPAVVRAAGNRFARDYLLWITPSEVDAVNRAHRTDYLLHGLATLAALVVYVVARLIASPYTVALVAVSAGAALSSVLRLRQAGRDFAPAPTSPTVARTRAVLLRDYLPPQTLVVLGCCPIIVLGALGIGVDAVRRNVDNVERAWFVVASGSAVFVLGALIPILAVAMTRRPQPATDSGHLYLQDAWRVERLREMLWGECVGVTMVCTQAHHLLPVTGDISFWLLPLLLVPPGVMIAFGTGRLHFRRRLWPELARGQKVVVGSIEPVGTAA